MSEEYDRIWVNVRHQVEDFLLYHIYQYQRCEDSCNLQTVLTVIIGGVGILLIVASVVSGDASNLTPQLFAGDSASTTMKAIMSVAVMTPFFFIGFDVIPQAAEEINVPLKKSV